MSAAKVLYRHGNTLQVYPQGMFSRQAAAACAEDANLSRKLAAVLSLPLTKSASARSDTSSSSFWPPKSFTDSGEVGGDA